MCFEDEGDKEPLSRFASTPKTYLLLFSVLCNYRYSLLQGEGSCRYMALRWSSLLKRRFGVALFRNPLPTSTEAYFVYGMWTIACNF